MDDIPNTVFRMAIIDWNFISLIIQRWCDLKGVKQGYDRDPDGVLGKLLPRTSSNIHRSQFLWGQGEDIATARTSDQIQMHKVLGQVEDFDLRPSRNGLD